MDINYIPWIPLSKVSVWHIPSSTVACISLVLISPVLLPFNPFVFLGGLNPRLQRATTSIENRDGIKRANNKQTNRKWCFQQYWTWTMACQWSSGTCGWSRSHNVAYFCSRPENRPSVFAFFFALWYFLGDGVGGCNPPTPLAAGGARQRRNYQQQGPRSHYKQQGQEARKQERRSKKQEAITGNKRQEARNKTPGSNKRLEDRLES